MTCTVEGCSKLINRDNLCLRHKLLKVNIGTVPGGAKDERTKISYGREMEASLNDYQRRRQAGERPGSIMRKRKIIDRKKEELWEKNETFISDLNDEQTVKTVRHSLLNQ